LTICTTV